MKNKKSKKDMTNQRVNTVKYLLKIVNLPHKKIF